MPAEEMPPLLRELPENLTGERVVVRPYCPADGPALYASVVEAREHLYQWLPFATPEYSLTDANSHVRRAQARWLLREDLAVGIFDRAGGGHLGGSGLHRIDWTVPAFEIGYWLRKSAEGRGLMTETVTLLCHFAFAILGANRLEIRCDTRNERSAAIPTRLGFLKEATLRNDARATSGELRDTFVFAMTPEDYQRQFPAQAPHLTKYGETSDR